MSFAMERLRLNARIEAAADRPSRTPAPSASIAGVAEREAMLQAAVAPSADYRRMSRRLARRQAIGGDGSVPANDNQGWPLAEQLRRDGNEVLVHVAERYRSIYDAGTYEPRLVGKAPDELWSPEQAHTINQKTGKLKVNGQKRSKTAASMPVDHGGYKVVPVTEEAWDALVANGPRIFKRRPAAPVVRKWDGDNALIAAIDARPMLRRLQAALGPLLDVFEDAVLDGATLSSIGEAKGFGVSGRGAAGRALVMLGLEVVQRELREIDRMAE